MGKFGTELASCGGRAAGGDVGKLEGSGDR